MPPSSCAARWRPASRARSCSSIAATTSWVCRRSSKGPATSNEANPSRLRLTSMDLSDYLPHITFSAAVVTATTLITIPWVLITKKDPTSAVAWCLAVLLMPLVGAILYWIFGYNRVHRLVRRKRKHHVHYRERQPHLKYETDLGGKGAAESSLIAAQAVSAGGYPAVAGNNVALYN